MERNRCNKINQKHITYMSLLLNTATCIIGLCKTGCNIRSQKQFYSYLPFEGCLVYQMYRVQYLPSHKPGFWGYNLTLDKLCQANLSSVD